MTNMQRIRLGLLCVQIKLGMITKDAWSGQKDPNPENWRTISGAHVHLENGKIDGGAGGKFSGQEWNGKVAHGSEKRGRISNHIEGMKSLGLRQGLSEKLNNAYENYEDDKQGNLKTIRLQASERVRAEAEKKLSELKPPDMLELAKEFKYATRNNLSKEENQRTG